MAIVRKLVQLVKVLILIHPVFSVHGNWTFVVPTKSKKFRIGQMSIKITVLTKIIQTLIVETRYFGPHK